MNYYFLECCFESDSKIAMICERLGCLGKHKFCERSHKKETVMLRDSVI